jgi:hypothetical protein
VQILAGSSAQHLGAILKAAGFVVLAPLSKEPVSAQGVPAAADANWEELMGRIQEHARV